MKTITNLKRLLLFIPLAVLGIKGNSQNAPIGCDSKFFLSFGTNNTSTSATTVNQLSISGGAISGMPFATNPSNIGYNAIGLNPIDGYMYGLRYPVSGDRVRLVRIGSGTPNNVTDLGELKNASGTNLQNGLYAYGGCFDENGTYYFTTTNNRLFSLANTELGNGASQRDAVYIATLTPSNYFADIAINPVDGQMYGVTIGGDFGVYAINKSTGAVNRLGSYPNNGNINSTSMIGLFFTEDGNMYAYRTDGNFYLLSKTDGSGTAAGTGGSYQYADGCSCSFGRVYHEITSQKGICPGLGGINFPEWDITVSVTNQTSDPQTGLTYTLEIPSNRFSMIETPADIATRLFTAGLIPANNPALVTISTVAPASGIVKNKIVVTSFQTGAPGSTVSFTLKLKFVTIGGPYAPVPLQSNIAGLPASIGSSDLSNDPTTAAPDDPTIITFCPNITLPVKLISFTGSYKNGTTQLNWEAENQVNFAYYDVERSVDGNTFNSIAFKLSQSNNSSKEYYLHNDDISAESNKVFYYRLKMVDIDGKFKYSNVILIRKDAKSIKGITISPNPLITGDAGVVRFESSIKCTSTLRVLDITGRIVLQQQNKITEGINSIPVNNLNKLQPGMYIIQMSDGNNVSAIKFSVTR